MGLRNGTCRGCSRPVCFAEDPEGVTHVLEPHESAAGAGRMAIFDDGFAHPVPARREVLAHETHECEGLRRHRAGIS